LRKDHQYTAYIRIPLFLLCLARDRLAGSLPFTPNPKPTALQWPAIPISQRRARRFCLLFAASLAALALVFEQWQPLFGKLYMLPVSSAAVFLLEGIAAVRKRPAMYIGDTTQRGLHHLVYEVIDNSIDEALAGFCTKVEVAVHPDHSVTVVDNGRGIPVDMHLFTEPCAVKHKGLSL